MATDLQSAPFGHLGTCPKHSAQQIQVLSYDCLLHPHDEKRRAGWSAHISPLLIKRMKAVSRGHSLVQETLDSIDEVWRCQDPKAELSCFFLRHPLICRNLPGTMLPGPIFFIFAFLDTRLPSEAHLSRTPRRHFMGLRRYVLAIRTDRTAQTLALNQKMLPSHAPGGWMKIP